MKVSIFSFAALLLPSLVSAQLSGDVGPLTTYKTKLATKTCNVLNYGAVADKSTDLGPPLTSAWAACKSGGVVVIPSGNYALETWVTLTGGSATGIQLDGIIYRTGTSSGNMIFIEHTTDFELYSTTSEGAVQGYGYVFHKAGSYGARILRLYKVTHFSIHDIALVDAPQYHLSMDTCEDGEVYNMVIYGGNEGGLDGIDVWGSNMYIHDIEVSNKDECVTVKNPSDHMLISDIYCNWSGGCAIGSLGADTYIHHIEYQYVYSANCNQMMMLKSNGGSGNVTRVSFTNFIGHANAYSLDINGYWTDASEADGDGVLYTKLTFEDWKGDCANGATRAPINVICPDGNPCTNIQVEDFSMWTNSGSKEYYKCRSAWGDGGCLRSGSAHTSYTTSTVTVTTATSWSASYMPSDLTTGFAISKSISIPTIPTSFYPGRTPVSSLLGSS
ncbi:MAG: hypothetical protein M1834_006355 [Cirrosporium novae-zelandiae]|nr:MAG: hypothetical protein M1834_006355 [Cirrosporium novae-zelandiae]